MKAYKGFNKDMTCRGFKFVEGMTYEEQDAKLCNKGFHACENPLDCFGYYMPGSSVYHEVEMEDVSPERDDDSKVVAKRITIGARLNIADIVKAHFDYTTAKCEKIAGSVAGDNQAVAVTYSKSCSAGYRGSASAGYRGSASAGNWGSASAGNRGSASAGNWGSASAGDWGSASAGKQGVAACRGGRVKGGLGCLLAACEINDDGDTIGYAAGIVDGVKIKPDVWYVAKDGEFVEA